MSMDCLLPGYWNPDTCVATSDMNRPRLFTHWVPRLQTLNESSLLQLRRQPTYSWLKFIDDYSEDAQRGKEKEHAFTSLAMLESTHKPDECTVPIPGENITTRIASPSCTDPGSPRCHLPRLITTTHNPPFSQSSDLDSPTPSLSTASSLFSEAMEEDSCPPEYLPQNTSACRDEAGVPSSGGVRSVSIAES